MSFELNQDIEATAFAGEVRADIQNLQADVTEMKNDVRHVRQTIDRWGGAVAIIGAAISALVSFAVAIIK